MKVVIPGGTGQVGELDKAAGGVPWAVFPTSCPELIRMTAGTPADVG